MAGGGRGDIDSCKIVCRCRAGAAVLVADARAAGRRAKRASGRRYNNITAAADGCALVLTTSWRAVAAVEPPTNQCSRNRCNTTVRVCVMFTECKLKNTHATSSSGSFRGAQ